MVGEPPVRAVLHLESRRRAEVVQGRVDDLTSREPRHDLGCDGQDASALTIPSALLKRRADLRVHAKFKLKGGRHARVSYNIRAVVRFMGAFYRRETWT
jgi:hypothetical protein